VTIETNDDPDPFLSYPNCPKDHMLDIIYLYVHDYVDIRDLSTDGPNIYPFFHSILHPARPTSVSKQIDGIPERERKWHNPIGASDAWIGFNRK
jgi:hypothetical protein